MESRVKMAASIKHVRLLSVMQKRFVFDVGIVLSIPRVCHQLYRGRLSWHGIRYFSSNESYRSNTGTRKYWDDFYNERKSASGQSFDWFFAHDVANQWLAECIFTGKTGRVNVVNVLELGCGTSTLASNLLKGNGDIMSVVCLDFALSAVGQAQSISRKICSSGRESLQFIAADASRLPFRNDQFDVVFEKGTFDAMLNGGRSGLARLSFGETVRVLSSQGIFLQFSDENPDIRLSFLEEALRESGMDRTQASVTFQDVGCSYGVEYFLYSTKLSKL
ncbi:methyltransferase-like protein 12, mitochondrial [Acanthaster planci]|uniref:Methyltransferase-like protein 12, mitochondrial n=1 Tax=Acanthaster planci TaxID=133434 RepID=A0A8B7YUE0_ACAPL|nr:methyltransferase-like protein 12, mitochondrial [Acanthaster planci]